MSTSHQDKSRKDVGSTAHAVAYMRGLESEKDNALIHDPYATALGTTIGKSTTYNLFKLTEDESGLDQLGNWVAGIGVRSRGIDDKIMEAIKGGFRQVVVLGAGLDTRPWRLGNKGDVDQSILLEVNWFEVDFKELFDYKVPILQEFGANTAVNYHAIIADLSLEDWFTSLTDSVYNPDIPTYWLLEGLTGYLTEEECRKLFSHLYQKSAVGSCILATFVTPNRRIVNPLHRFNPTNPLEFVQEIGWIGEQQDLNVIAVEYGRESSKVWDGYKLVKVYKQS